MCPQAMVLTMEDVASIETVAHYTHDEDQAYCMLYGALSSSVEDIGRGCVSASLLASLQARNHPSASQASIVLVFAD